jgi:uncharacterized repeat protein (TIGR02543 family)
MHQGVVTDTTGPVTITPVYWAPSGFVYPSTYEGLTQQFVDDVAAASGTTSNVFSVLTQYDDAKGNYVKDDFAAGAPILDSTPYPVSGGCSPDTGQVYEDGSGYSACLTDTQITTELGTLLAAHGLATDLNHLYLVFLPKGVESCSDTNDDAQGGMCTLSAAGGAFCGYHSDDPVASGTILYADLPYAVVDNPVNSDTCSSDAGSLAGGGAVGNQSPNDNIDADTEISIASHEISESITDPLPTQGWADSAGNEVADECEYIYGDSSTFQGVDGAEYNQMINGHPYFLQEEFSNGDYALNPAGGCMQRSDLAASVTFIANGGVGTMPVETSSTPQALSANAFTRTGYVFSGWNTSASATGTSYAPGALYNFASSLTLYAQWSALATTVSFNANGGVGTMPAETSAAPRALSANAFTRTGYVFSGWSTSASATGTSYAPGATYNFAASLTLYAQWTLRAPSPPSAVAATDVRGTPTLHWRLPSATADIVGYRIFEGTSPGFTPTVPLVGASLVRGTSFRLVHLTPGVHYYFKVATVNTLGTSSGSRGVRVTLAKVATTSRLQLSTPSILFGSQHGLTLSARVLARTSSSRVTGVVVFRVGSRALCSARVASGGVARCRLGSGALNRGSYVVVGRFSGSGSLLASSSSGERLRIV